MNAQDPADNYVNTSPRLAVSLCLDVSGSMGGRPLDELRGALAEFYDDIRRDPQVAATAQVGVTVFAREVWSSPRFDNLGPDDAPPELSVRMEGLLPDGRSLEPGTNLGRGVKEAADRLMARVVENKQRGLARFRPFLVILSDGHPTDRRDSEQVAAQVRRSDRRGDLLVLPVGVGPRADYDALSLYSAEERPAFRVSDPSKFREMFRIVSESIAQFSKSRPGEDLVLSSRYVKQFRTPDPAAPPADPGPTILIDDGWLAPLSNGYRDP